MSGAERDDEAILVLGLGDLGQRVLHALSQRPGPRLIAAARDPSVAAGAAGQAALVAELSGVPRRVDAARIDLDDSDGTAEELARMRPAVIVLAAARATWWRLPARVDALPYGVWLPLHVALVRRLMEARAAAAVTSPVVALPYPDAVGPVLAGAGLAPEVGAGNVLEMAAKLATVTARRTPCARDRVDVRLVAHHATERLAFSAFSGLAGREPAGPPPVLARVLVDGEALPGERAREYLTAPYALPSGRETHRLTAAATVATVEGLLSDEPRRLHVPAPGGRPGGYPVLISRAGVALDLPPGVTEADAVAINAVAARWDGIERIDDDGTVTFCSWVGDDTERVLGIRLERVGPGEHAAVADVLAAQITGSAGPR